MEFIKKLFSKEKKIKIDFCEKNLDRFVNGESLSKYSSFLNHEKVDYREYDCQSKCKQCSQAPYAIVNGEFINAENCDELLEKLKRIVG